MLYCRVVGLPGQVPVAQVINLQICARRDFPSCQGDSDAVNWADVVHIRTGESFDCDCRLVSRVDSVRHGRWKAGHIAGRLLDELACNLGLLLVFVRPIPLISVAVIELAKYQRLHCWRIIA